jgi:Domain of unknown function (DUF4167)
MNRRPMHNNRDNRGGNNNNGGGGNNRFRRGGGNNQHRGRSGGGMDHEQEGEFVSPQQRRHAQNQQVKYQDLARNARQNGDRVEMEYYLQHVEHYTRVITLGDLQQRERDEARGGSPRHNNNPNQHSRHERGESNDRNEQPYDGEAMAATVAATIERAERERSAERPHHPQHVRDDRHVQPRETVDAGDREPRRHYGNDESEQQRRLRNFRQPRQAMTEREIPEAAQESLPIPPLHHALAADVQAEPIRRGRGRPRKQAALPEADSGLSLAAVLPIL